MIPIQKITILFHEDDNDPYQTFTQRYNKKLKKYRQRNLQVQEVQQEYEYQLDVQQELQQQYQQQLNYQQPRLSQNQQKQQQEQQQEQEHSEQQQQQQQQEEHSIRLLLQEISKKEQRKNVSHCKKQQQQQQQQQQQKYCQGPNNPNYRKLKRSLPESVFRGYGKSMIFSFSSSSSFVSSSVQETSPLISLVQLSILFQFLLLFLSLDTIAAQATSSFSVPVCIRYMAASDSNRDSLLDPMEYVKLINQLSNNAYSSATFDTMPMPIQITFTKYAVVANGGQIDISGSKPGQEATSEQSTLLSTMCNGINAAIQASISGGNSGSGGSAPVPMTSTTTAPANMPTTSTDTTVITTCYRDMTIADASRDSQLNQQEYVRYVSRIDTTVSITDLFTSLTTSAQDNFVSLATGTDNLSTAYIDITGSKPGDTPTQDQGIWLTKVCTSTANAVAGGSSTNAPATAAPLPPSSTGAPNSFAPTNAPVGDGGENDNTASDPANTTIYNSFLFSNTLSLKAADFIVGSQFRNQIKSAYTNFITAVLTNFTSLTIDDRASNLTTGNTSRYRHLRYSNKHLLEFEERSSFYNSSLVGFVQSDRSLQQYQSLSNSYNVYQFDDTTCPPFVTVTASTFCLIAFASFGVDLSAEKDPVATQKTISAITQKYMNDTIDGMDNLFQQELLKVDPTVQLRIESSSEPVQPSGGNDNNNAQDGIGSGSSNNNILPSSSENDGTSAGAVVGSFFIVFFIIGLASWLWHRQRRSEFKIIPMEWRQILGLENKAPTFNDDNINESLDNKTTVLSGEVEDANNDNHRKNKVGGKSIDDGGNVSTDDDEGSTIGFHVHDQPNNTKQKNNKGAAVGSAEKESGFGFVGKFPGSGKKKNNTGKEDLGVFGEDGFEDQEDFAKYAFYDPPEAKPPSNTNMNHNNNKNNNSDPFGNTIGWKIDDTNNGWGTSTGWDVTGKKNTKDEFFTDETGSEDDEDDDNDVDDEDDDNDDGYGFEKDAGVNRRIKTGLDGEAVITQNVQQLNTLVDNGNWNGVVTTKVSTMSTNGSLERDDGIDPSDAILNDDDESTTNSRDNGDNLNGNTDGGGVDKMEGSGKSIVHDSLSGDSMSSSGSHSVQDRELRKQYRAEVEALVKMACPDEYDNINAMMKQFAGREPELIQTLQKMSQRSVSQRAMKAIHKSKAIPDRETNRTYAIRGAEGSAVIAAASMLNNNPENGRRNQHNNNRSNNHKNESDDERSHTSYDDDDDDNDGRSYNSRSYSSRRSDDRSEVGSEYQSDNQSDNQSDYRSENQSDYHSDTGSHSGDSRSHSRSSHSGSRSYDDDDYDGSSHIDSRTNDDDNGSRTDSRSRSYSRSYPDEGSYTGSRTSRTDDDIHEVRNNGNKQSLQRNKSMMGKNNVTNKKKGGGGDDDDQTYDSRSRSSGTKSYMSGSGSRSYYSNDDRTQGSMDGSKSNYSGTERSASSHNRSDHDSYSQNRGKNKNVISNKNNMKNPNLPNGKNKSKGDSNRRPVIRSTNNGTGGGGGGGKSRR